MKNIFYVQNTKFESFTSISNKINVKSFPHNYDVIFTKFENQFSNDEIVLVDSKVKNIYNIQHDKLISIDATEANKSMETVIQVCDKLIQFNFNKGNKLVVIGGGIIQDIAAFTSKIFKRGINWKLIPTTLLSQCDSCIGGKTALNFKTYKNQLALYSSPEQVIIDVNFLKTIPKEEIISGYGEIIKLFLIGGEFYLNNLTNLNMEQTIFHSLSIKKAVIEFDEFEKCERKSLNYGHSFGHAIESVTNYSIPHGESVLLGIEIINKLFGNSKKISNLISLYTNMNKIKNIDTSNLISHLKFDKKIHNGIISLVEIETPGKTIFIDIAIDKEFERRVNEILTD